MLLQLENLQRPESGLEKSLALGGRRDVFFGPVLGDRSSRDQDLALTQSRGDFFVFQGMIGIFLRHHFLDHLPNRHRRQHVR